MAKLITDEMSEEERALLRSFLLAADCYLEFGAGASTLTALGYCKIVTTVDSSPTWVRYVSQVASSQPHCALRAIHADVGQVMDYGDPVVVTKNTGRVYSSAADEFIPDANFVLIDGRFRVACFAKLAMLGFRGPIAVHDYPNRSWYHIIENLGVRIAQAGTLSVFLVTHGDLAPPIWEQHLNDSR